MKIYAARVCEIPDGFCGRLFPLLDRRRQEKVTALKNEKERLRSIYAGLLLRHAFLAEGHCEEMWQRIEIVEEVMESRICQIVRISAIPFLIRVNGLSARWTILRQVRTFRKWER